MLKAFHYRLECVISGKRKTYFQSVLANGFQKTRHRLKENDE